MGPEETGPCQTRDQLCPIPRAAVWALLEFHHWEQTPAALLMARSLPEEWESWGNKRLSHMDEPSFELARVGLPGSVPCCPLAVWGQWEELCWCEPQMLAAPDPPLRAKTKLTQSQKSWLICWNILWFLKFWVIIWPTVIKSHENEQSFKRSAAVGECFTLNKCIKCQLSLMRLTQVHDVLGISKYFIFCLSTSDWIFLPGTQLSFLQRYLSPVSHLNPSPFPQWGQRIAQMRNCADFTWFPQTSSVITH